MNFENNLEPENNGFETGLTFESPLDDFYTASGVVLEGGKVLDVTVWNEGELERRFSLPIEDCQSPEDVMESLRQAGLEAVKTNPSDIRDAQFRSQHRGGNPVDQKWGAGGSAS